LGKQLLILSLVDFKILLLPVQHRKRFIYQLLLLLGFCDFTGQFLLRVKSVELGVYLLFSHLLFNLAALVNQLLLSLNLGTSGVEPAVFLPQRVILHFELLV